MGLEDPKATDPAKEAPLLVPDCNPANLGVCREEISPQIKRMAHRQSRLGWFQIALSPYEGPLYAITDPMSVHNINCVELQLLSRMFGILLIVYPASSWSKDNTRLYKYTSYFSRP